MNNQPLHNQPHQEQPMSTVQSSNTQPRTDKSRPPLPAESPLDKALAAFKAANPNRLSSPIPRANSHANGTEDGNANASCTRSSNRWANIPPPKYRPSFTYLGEANPEFYANPVAVPSLRFVGAPLPWAEERGVVQMQQAGEDPMESKGTEGKASAKGKKNTKAKPKNDEGKGKGKSKAKPAQATKKTPTSAVPKPPVQASGGRQTRSMSKAAVNSGTAESISTGPKINASESDALDARPAKRARVSESQEGTASNQVSEKLVTGLPPLSVVRKRSNAEIGDENEVGIPAGDEKSTIVAAKEEVEATPLETTTKDNVDGIAQQAQAINKATEESLKGSCTDVEVQETREAEVVAA